jgi:transcriptional regulator with XRE-family HTH domain
VVDKARDGARAYAAEIVATWPEFTEHKERVIREIFGSANVPVPVEDPDTRGATVVTGDEDPARLFRWLTDVHEAWGWTQTRFAELVGKTTSGMRRWNEGAHPTDGTLRAVARAVGVSQDDLRAVMRGELVPVPPPPRTADASTQRERIEVPAGPFVELVSLYGDIAFQLAGLRTEVARLRTQVEELRG